MENLDKLDFIDEYIKDKYREVNDFEILRSTEKAMQIKIMDIIEWYPVSQLRTDGDNLYIAEWIYDKHF